jgi:hypothetical protein
MNRIAYAVEFVYWLAIHRSWSSAAWVMAHQGKVWK